MSRKKVIRPEHPNRERILPSGATFHVRPADKYHRYTVSPEIQDLADELRRLVNLLKINSKNIDNILLPRFGQSVGHETFLLFIDPVYGAGAKPRSYTLQKYNYLVKELKRIEANFKYIACNINDIT